MKLRMLLGLRTLPVILLIAWSVPGATWPEESGRTMTADEVIERLVAAQTRETEIVVQFKNGGNIRGRVAEVSRRTFVLQYGSRGHRGLPAVVEYDKIASVKQYNRLTSLLVTVRDRVLIGGAVVGFLSLSGFSYLFTGRSLHFC